MSPLRLFWLGLWLAFGAVVVPGEASGQAVQVTVPVAEADHGRHGIELRRNADGKVSAVRWGKREIPLPVASGECDLGLAGNGRYLVILAGGIRADSFDVLVAWGAGDLWSYNAKGGRRLPKNTPNARGSWPWIEGDAIVFFAFELDRRLEFRAHAPTGTATRSLSLADDGWEVVGDADQGFFEVRFPNHKDPVRLPHPDAPFLQVQKGVLVFGDVECKQVGRELLYLTNAGKRPLQAELDSQKAQFRIDGDRRLKLAPRETRHVVVLFEPQEPGAVEGRIQVQANGRVRDLVVTLRGNGVSKAKVESNASRPTNVASSSRPAVAAAPVELQRPMFERLNLYPAGTSMTLVVGRLSAPLSAGVELLGCSGGGPWQPMAVDGGGRFCAILKGGHGAPTRFVVRQADRYSQALHGPDLPLRLSVHDESVQLRGVPGRAFLLLLTPRHSSHELAAWRGRYGVDGSWSTPVKALPRLEKTDLLLVDIGEDGAACATRLPLIR